MAKQKTTRKKPGPKPKARSAKSTTAKSKTAVKRKTVAKATAKKKTAAPKPRKTTIKKTAKKPLRKSVAKKAAPKARAQRAPKPAPKQTQSTPRNASPSNPTPPFNPMETMMKQAPFNYEQMAQEAANSSRENMEALAKSGSIFAKGMEDIMRASMSLAQNTAEKQAEFMKQAMATKSLNDFTQMQSMLAKQGYEDFVSNTTKISEMSVQTLTSAVEPLNTQINKAVQKASETMAA